MLQGGLIAVTEPIQFDEDLRKARKRDRGINLADYFGRILHLQQITKFRQKPPGFSSRYGRFPCVILLLHISGLME